MFVSEKVKTAFIISDTCSAGTLFHSIKSDLVKALMIGSSTWDDSSLSDGYDKYIGQPMGDKFTRKLMIILDKIKTQNKQYNFLQFTKEFPKNKIESQIFYFNYLNKKKKDININEYLVNKPTKIQEKDFWEDMNLIESLWAN